MYKGICKPMIIDMYKVISKPMIIDKLPRYWISGFWLQGLYRYLRHSRGTAFICQKLVFCWQLDEAILC